MSLNKMSFYSLSSLFGDLWMNNGQLLKGGETWYQPRIPFHFYYATVNRVSGVGDRIYI